MTVGNNEDLRRRIQRAGQVLTVPLALYSVAPGAVEAAIDDDPADPRMVKLGEDELREIDARGFPERVRDRLVDDEVNRGTLSTLERTVPIDTRRIRDLARNASEEFNRRVRDRIDRLRSSDLATVVDAVRDETFSEGSVADGFSFRDAFYLVRGTSRFIKAVTEAEGALERTLRQR